MGQCLEFAATITAGCDHPMEAHSDCCVCEVCGTRCVGHFGGCAAVWAAVTAPRPLAMAEDVQRPAAAAATVAVIDADLAIDWGADGAALVAQPDARLPRFADPRTPMPHQRRRLAAVAVVVVLVGAGLGSVLAGGDSADGSGVGVVAARPPELQFKPVTIADGASLERNWRLEGSTGHRFIGTLEFSNTTDAVVPVTYDETLPKSLAKSVDVVLWDPYPIVIDPDPVVQYQLELQPGTTVTVTYEISVPPDGADPSRLDAWAKDVEDELAQAVADAEAALAAAKTAAERALAQALLDAAQEARRSFKPTPKAPGCRYCGGGSTPGSSGGGDGSTTPSSEEPTTTTTEEPTTTSTEVTTTSDPPITTTTDCSSSPEGCPPPPDP